MDFSRAEAGILWGMILTMVILVLLRRTRCDTMDISSILSVQEGYNDKEYR